MKEKKYVRMSLGKDGMAIKRDETSSRWRTFGGKHIMVSLGYG